MSVNRSTSDSTAEYPSSVSIIVPIYKVREVYLRQCIESIMNQTLRDLEIILIDDGSPDNCGGICDEYAKKDSRIVVIHQENQGVSAARNAGIQTACGKWITFVDADDWIELDMCEAMVQYAETNNCDVLACGSYKEYLSSKSESIYPYLQSNGIVPCADTKRLVLGVLRQGDPPKYVWTHPSLGITWGKLIRQELIENHGLRYPAGIPFGQDKLFYLPLFFYSNRAGYIDRCFYHYRQVRGSVSRCYNESVIDRMKQLLYGVSSFFDVHYPDEQEFIAACITCAQDYICVICGRIFEANDLSLHEKKRAMAKVVNDDYFSEALTKIRLDKLPSRVFLQLLLLKCHLFGAYILLKRCYLWINGRTDQYE